MGFGFPKPTPACSDSISTVLLGHLTLFPSLVFFLFLSFVKSSLLIYAGLLPPLLHLLLIRVDHCWAWRRCSLKINQLSKPYSLQDHIPWDLPKHTSQSLFFPSSGLGSCILSYSLLSVFWTPPSCVCCSWDSPWPSQPWPALCKAWGLAEHLPSSAPQAFVLGSCHHCTAEAWIAHSLFLLPCFSRKYRDD